MPVFDQDDKAFSAEIYAPIIKELTDIFGDITIYTRTPATGLWKEGIAQVVKDDIIEYEVMTEEVESLWWKDYKEQLRIKFNEDELIVRSTSIELL